MEKRKTNINRPKISSEEIAGRRDFNSVLNSYQTIVKPVSKPFFENVWFITGTSIVAASIIALTAFYRLFNDNGNDKDKTKNSYVYSPGEDSAGERTAFINPPFKGLNIEYENYIIDAEKGGDLEYKTGSTIRVPKNAFFDENGDLIKGSVEIRYREFHNPIDFIVAGIPMTYDSAGIQHHFESAGMMEILAFQDGKSVYVNPDNLIAVEMVSEYDGTKYNLYSLDTVAGSWKFEGKDKVIKPEPDDYEISLSDQLEGDNTVLHYNEVENRALLERDKKPVVPKKASDDRYRFDLDVDAEEFPELSVYKGMLFEVADDSKFNTQFYTIIWEEAALQEAKEKGRYSLKLKKGDEKYNLEVYPVFEGKDYQEALEIYEQKFADYRSRLEERKAKEQRKEKELARLMKKRAEENLQKRDEGKGVKNTLEEQRKRLFAVNTAYKVRRAFQINGFGVWNCDNPLRFPGEKKLEALFMDKQYRPGKNNMGTSGSDKYLRFVNMFLIEKDRNAIFTVDLNNLNKFSYNPDKENMIIGVTTQNHLAVYPFHEFAGVPKKTRAFTFKMQVYKRQFNTVSEIEELIDNDFQTEEELSDNNKNT